MTLYADILFVTNLLLDLAILKTTAWVGKVRTVRWRLWLAASVGAAYVVMIFFPGFSILYTFFIKALFSLAMVYIAFGFHSLQSFIRHLGLFYAVNFMVAGGIFAFHYMLQSTHEVMNGVLLLKTGGSAYPVQMSMTFIGVAFMIVLIFYRFVHRSKERRNMTTDYIAQLQVTIDGVEVTCNGLIDTGNQLYDPFTRTPVMIMSIDVWKHRLPEPLINVLLMKDWDDWMEKIPDGSQWSPRLRIVPFKGIQNDQQMMIALKPDKVVIRYQDQELHPTKVLVGFHGSRLSSDGSYEAIIHPAFVQANEKAKIV